MTYQLASSISQRTSRYPGKTLRWTTCLRPPLNSTTSSMGMTTSKIFSSMFMDWMRASRLDLTFFS